MEIHVLGAGKGESIILGWPDNRWGVVDCYAPSVGDHTTNPTFRFLKDRGVTDLEFVCLTHPHDDHFRGMSHLLTHFKVHHFWRFPTLGVRELRQLAKYMHMESRRSGDTTGVENAGEFVSIMQRVNELLAHHQINVAMVSGHQQLYPIPFDTTAPFQVWSFAPHGNQLTDYERSLSNSFTADDKFKSNPPHVSHNDVSVGLLIKFGGTQIVLGGDVERAAWNDICPQHQRQYFSADAVKVPHHGSDTGYITDLWPRFSGKKKPIALIAPYRRFRLPKQESLLHIGQHVSRLLLTCDTSGLAPPCSAGPHLKSRMFLRAKLKARSPLPDGECGMWSLEFDANGNCVQENHKGPACEYEMVSGS